MLLANAKAPVFFGDKPGEHAVPTTLVARVCVILIILLFWTSVRSITLHLSRYHGMLGRTVEVTQERKPTEGIFWRATQEESHVGGFFRQALNGYSIPCVVEKTIIRGGGIEGEGENQRWSKREREGKAREGAGVSLQLSPIAICRVE